MGPIHLHRQAAGPRILSFLLLLASFGKVQAGCTTAFTVTATPPPAGGLYSCGQTVTFCLTVSGWGVVNNNWLHGVVADFGPGWDMSTLVPGTPPATIGGSGGTWGWYPSVDGTSTSPDNTGAQGPGFFFDLDNDGDPGDNFGDFATTGPWTFCWTISVLGPPACTPGTDVSVIFSVFGDSQTGSWNTGGCGGATLTTVPAQVGGGCPSAGADHTLTLCGNAPPTALFPLLGAAATGGTWTGPGGIASTGTYNPAVQLPGAYVYTIAASPGCPADQAVVTVNEQAPVNAGADGILSICSSSPPANLFGSLAGAMGGGTWTGPGGAPFSGTYDPATHASGVYTYTVTGTAPCPNDQATVTVTEQPAPNAGVDGILSICSNGAATALFPLLAGSTAGGTWTGPGGTPFNGTYDPAAHASGTYTYTVAGAAPCPNDQATVTVTEEPAPSAGADGTLSICSNGTATALLPLIAGAPAGGTWTGPGGTPFNGTYDPAVQGSGVYIYTVAGVAPCPSDQATVTVTEQPMPIAGADADLSVCSNSAATALFPLLIGAQGGGTWTDPGGAPFSGTYDPATAATGTYTYTVPGTAPCPNDQTTVTVQAVAAPDAGGDGALTLCAQGAPTDLFSALSGATAGGTWTAPGGAAHGPNYDPTVDVPGNYVYTVAGAPPCTADQAIVAVTETTTPDAGTDGTLTLCANGAPVALFPALTAANAGGTWTAPNGTPHSGLIDPTTEPAGIYTYTVAAAEPCLADQAQVTVVIHGPPNAGVDGALAVCAQGAPANLFAQLIGAAPGGTWTAPSGAAHGPNYDPAVDPPGTYTYTVNGPSPCPADQAVVVVTATATPYAGADGAIALCATDAPADLFAQLIGADGGGSWTAPNGVAHGASLDPSVDAAGVYTYTIAAVAPCAGDVAQVTVAINNPPNAGMDGAITLCAQGAPANLFAQLVGATAGGSWTDPNGAAHSAFFDPASDPIGIYTYTLSGTAPCPADHATVTVGLTATPNAGSDGSMTLCATDAPPDLFLQLIGADAGGTWTAPNGAVHGASLDPSVDAAGVYTYTIAAIAPCAGDVAQVTVAINNPPNAGMDGAITLCAQGAPANLFAQLVGATAGGSWTDPNGAAHSAFFDPASDPIGIYTYTLNGVAPCPADHVTVTVGLTATPNAGSDGAMTLCATDAPTDLFAQLIGADAGGTWTAPGGTAHGASLDPSVDAAGVYTYTIAAVAPCAADVAQVTVAINNPPNAGSDGAITLCTQGAPTSLFAQLAGATVGGSWTGPMGAAHGPFFDSASDPIGIYTYTLGGAAPCPADQATVTVGLTATPNAGGDGSLTLCATDAPTDLFAQLIGADAGGTWTAPNGAAHGASLDPSIDAAGVYTYTIAAIAPCAGDVAQVIVTINNPPNAGADGAIILCAQGAPTSLFAQLAGATAGGSWTDPTGAAHGPLFAPASDPIGTYTYTLSGSAPCPADQAMVTVGLTATPNAGSDGSMTLCATDASADLFAQLIGADAGGSWTAPSGAAHSASLDPSVDAAGVYTYTIAAIAPCAGDVAQVTVVINNPPNAGGDGAIILCAQGAPADLFAQLAGATAGGSWTDPNGAAHSAFFDPASDPIGIYTYTLSGVAPCPADHATVTIGLTATPNAGSDGTMTLCATDAPTDLFAQLAGADAGGTWTAPNGAAHGASLDPSLDPAGVYTYTIAAVAPCAGDAAHVTVAIRIPPHAGTDAVLSACDQGGVIDLFAQLVTADEGGNWTGPDGLPHSIVFDPTVDGPGTYTYSLAGDPPCPSDAATVTVNVVTEPDAGSDGARMFCTSDATSPLFAALGGTPDMGGTWTGPNGILHGPDLDPAFDAAGAYTYTVTASSPCPSASSVVTITIQGMPDAGNDGTLSLCSSAGSTDLFHALSGTPQTGGGWTDPNGNAMSGVFDPASGIPGGHVYTVAGIAPCPSSSAVVQIAIVGSPNAGGDAAVALCTNSDPFPLTGALAGTPDLTGTWTAPDGLSIPVLLDPTTAPSGTYTYIVGGDAPCVNDTARVAVTVHPLPTNGLSAEVSACASDAPFDPFMAFAGAAQPGGAWTAPSGSAIGTPLDPATAPSGIYTYTVTGMTPCPNGINTVTVHVDAPFTAGNDGSVVLCASDAPLSLFSELEGTPDANGTWTDPAGIPTDGMLDPATDAAGDHLYSVPANGACPGDQAAVNVVINVPPDAGLDNAMTWCENIGPIDPFLWLTGTPQAGGSWIDPYGMPFTGPLDPASAAEGPYTYTVLGLAPCPAASAVLTVAIDPLPNPGEDAAIALCPEAPAFDLMPLLGTPLTVGGTWNDPLGLPTTGLFDPATMPPGNYTYTLEGTGACVGNTLTSLVEVTVHAAPSAAFTADTTIGCIPLTVVFSAQDPSVASVLWQFDDGGTVTGTSTTSHTFNAAGSYTIQAVVTDTNGCTASLLAEDLIFVQPPPTAWFSADPDPTNTNDPEVMFTPAQGAYPGYAWTIDGHTAGSGAPWVHAFPDAIGGEYVVCLTVTDAIGCTATYCDPVRVEDALAYHVPNAFTPDGDGINDVFAPIMVGADRERYSFFIFDRWGMLVFESHTVGEAWDGTMRDHGDALPEDVYVWRLLVGDRFSTYRKEEMGHVTLLR